MRYPTPNSNQIRWLEEKKRVRWDREEGKERKKERKKKRKEENKKWRKWRRCLRFKR